MIPLIRFQVNKRVELALRQGHPWVFRGQCSTALDAIPIGSFVRLVGTQNTFLGIGIYEPLSAIAIRIVSWKDIELTEAFFVTRLLRAWEQRAKGVAKLELSGFRWVHGEADQLPGVAIDVYDDIAIVQFYLPSWREVLREPISQALEKLHLRAAWEKPVRGKTAGPVIAETAPTNAAEVDVSVYAGDTSSPHEPLTFHESGRSWYAWPLTGLKTGFFLDLRQVRHSLAQLVKPGSRWLNLFANDGALSALLLDAGAEQVVSVERHEQGALQARALYRACDIKWKATDWLTANAWEYAAHLAQNEMFDGAIIDPPILATCEEQLPSAKHAWMKLHQRILQHLQPGANLLAISCTERLAESTLKTWMQEASRAAGKSVKLVKVLPGNFDHPVLPALKERDGFHALIWQIAAPRRAAEKPTKA